MRRIPDRFQQIVLLIAGLGTGEVCGQDSIERLPPQLERSIHWALSTASRLHPAVPSCPAVAYMAAQGQIAALQGALGAFGDGHTGVALAPITARLRRRHGYFPFEVIQSDEGLIVRKSQTNDIPVGAILVQAGDRNAGELAAGGPAGVWNDWAPAALGVRPRERVRLRWIDPVRGDTVDGTALVQPHRTPHPAAEQTLRVNAHEGAVVLAPGPFKTRLPEIPESNWDGGVVFDLRGHAGGGVQEAVAWARHFSGYCGPLPQAVVVKGSREARRLQPDRLDSTEGSDWHAVWRAVRAVPDGAVDTVRFASNCVPEAAWNGRCAVLVDGGTASAAAVLADWLQRRGRAVVIGAPWEPAAGGSYGNAVRAKDPTTGISIRVATAAFVWDTAVWEPCGLPGLPDLKLERSAAHWFTGNDPVLEAGIAWASGQPWRPDSITAATWMAREAPERWALWRSIERELKPHGAWRQAAWDAVASYAAEVAWADLEGALAERTPNSSAQAMQWAAAKTEAKQRRDAALRAACPSSNLAQLEQLLAPAKPAVLHFGIHDRMNCGVCKPGEQ